MTPKKKIIEGPAEPGDLVEVPEFNSGRRHPKFRVLAFKETPKGPAIHLIDVDTKANRFAYVANVVILKKGELPETKTSDKPVRITRKRGR